MPARNRRRKDALEGSMTMHEPRVLEAERRLKDQVVLCVDDDPAVLASLRRLLRREPYVVETVDSPQQALDRVEQGDVSLVLLDQRMPGMCGSDFAERVRQIS